MSVEDPQNQAFLRLKSCLLSSKFLNLVSLPVSKWSEKKLKILEAQWTLKKNNNDLKASLQKTEDENRAPWLRWILVKEQRKNYICKAKNAKIFEKMSATLKQCTLKNSLELRGVPQNTYTGTENVVIRVTEALNVSVEPENVRGLKLSCKVS